MPVKGYAFRTGVSAFFEMATADAQAVLPDYLCLLYTSPSPRDED